MPPRRADDADHLERAALRVITVGLVAVGMVTAVVSVIQLINEHHPSGAAAAVVLAAASLVALSVLALRKRHVAIRLPSRALKADGQLTTVGAVLAGVTLLGTAASAALGWWWADPAAALATAIGAIVLGILVHRDVRGAVAVTPRWFTRGMTKRIEMLRDELRTLVRDLDAALLDGRRAKAAVVAFAEIERLAHAGKALTARRVAATNVWARDGHRSFEEWLARVSGSGLGEAMATAETAARLEELPATEAALRTGTLSRVQVNEVAAAAAADPDSEDTLLHLAGTGTVKRLKDRAKHIKAAAHREEQAR